MCWRERITIYYFLAMPVHDRRLGTGGGRSDVDRLISGDGAIGDSPRGKAVALNRCNRCI